MSQLHYSQHAPLKTEVTSKSGKLSSAIEKAQAIQQREQLRQMVTQKFNKDFAKGNKNIAKIIEDIVADYFLKEKVTEESLRQLKTNVSEAVAEYRKTSQSAKAPSSRAGSQTSAKELKDRNNDDAKSQRSHQSNQSKRSAQQPTTKQEDKISNTSRPQSQNSCSSSCSSSQASRSVYAVEGDDED